MQHHTKGQAPREGQRPDSENPVQRVRAPASAAWYAGCPVHVSSVTMLAFCWRSANAPSLRPRWCRLCKAELRGLTHVQSATPTRKGYLQFLAESKAVYDTLEQIVEDAAHPDCMPRLSPPRSTRLLLVCFHSDWHLSVCTGSCMPTIDTGHQGRLQRAGRGASGQTASLACRCTLPEDGPGACRVPGLQHCLAAAGAQPASA